MPMKHSDYVEVVKGFGTTALKNALIKGAVKNLPFLASGPWNFVLVKIATKIAEVMAEQAELAIFFQYVDWRGEEQAKDFEAAMLHNHAVQINGTEQEKKDAEKKLQAALTKLASLSS